MKLNPTLHTLLRLAFIAVSLPIPSILHGQASTSSDNMTLPTIGDKPAESAGNQLGILRIGVAMPTSNLANAGDQTSAGALQQAEVRLLTGPNTQAIALTATNLQEANREAEANHCDFLLSSSILQTVPPQSRFSKLGGIKTLQLAASAAQFIPVVSVPAMIATMAGSQLASLPLASLATKVKAGSDITLQYSLRDPQDHALISDEEKAHSKADADDVVTPLVSHLVTQVVKAVRP